MKNSYFLLIIGLAAYFFSSIGLKSQGWESLAGCEQPNPFPVMAAADGKIYMLSGSQGTSIATRVYDPETNTWEDKAPIPEGCIYSSCGVVDGKIYVMGGGQSNQKKDNHYIYDPATDEWTEGAKLLTPRMYHSSAVVDGKIYLIGGQNGDGTTEWYFDEYDPATDTWTRKENTPHAEAWYCGAVGVDKKFYRIAGGRWNLPSAYVDVYDTESETWEVMDPIPNGIHAPAAVNFDGKIILMGGYCNAQKVDSIYMYYPQSNLWSLTLNRLPEPMAYHKAVVLGNYVYLYSKSEDAKTGRLWRYKYGSTEVEEHFSRYESSIVYPNPCSGKFRISIPTEMTAKPILKIYNSQGREIPAKIEYSIGDETANITLSNPATGLYFVNICSGVESLAEKIIVR